MPFRINDDISMEADVEASLRLLSLNKVGGHTHLREEHLNNWHRETYLVEGTSTPQTPEIRRKLADLKKYMWQNGDIPTELG